MSRFALFVSITLLALGTASAHAQNDAVGNDTDPPAPSASPAFESYRQLILDDRPVAWWSFDSSAESDASAAWAHAFTAVGKPDSQTSGPSAKLAPLMHDKNLALKLDGKSYLKVKDPGVDSPLDFKLGDTITLEAWIDPAKIGEGQNVYILGKGRTGNAGFPSENQNYALRLRGLNGSARISFLFRDERNRNGNADDWHRWTSSTGVAPGSGWHHVAVSYTFGEPESLVGWIDGERVAGDWDMGKQTTLGPVVDDDELWIGASMGGQAGNAFTGSIDELAIYRAALTDEKIRLRCPPIPSAREVADDDIPPGQVLVQIHEGIPDVRGWSFRIPEASDTYLTEWLTFPRVPNKYSERGIAIDRSNPFLVRAHCLLTLPAGEQRLLLRALNGARLSVDGKELAATPFHTISSSAHGTIRRVAQVESPHLRILQTGHNESLATFVSDGRPHRFTIELFVGGGKKRPELGEPSLSLETAPGRFEILGTNATIPLEDREWLDFEREFRNWLTDLNARRRAVAGALETQAWERRHAQAREQIAAELAAHPERFDAAAIDAVLLRALETAGESPRPVIGDWEFLRRVTLDVIGAVPTPEQIRQFFADPSAERRARHIDRLLEHPGWADHWVGYWQDVLAENPNIVNPTLNNTGPFRYWIHESFHDNKPIDRFVTELIRMEGSKYYGGPGGFEMATQNDAPMAAKAHVLGTAFLGVQMKCARCHDAPFHDIAQEDLFSLAAMLKRETETLPKTSTIPLSDETIQSLIVTVSLKPGAKIVPRWTFDEFIAESDVAELVSADADSRERLAALVTSPRNQRFRQVIVNRLWQRYFGRGLVEPVDDWEQSSPSHPDLLDALSRELVLSGYDLKHVARLILNSRAYQRAAVDAPASADEKFLFAGPARRRLSAEQLVDSIFVACGKHLHAGDMCIDVDGARDFTQSLNLGRPQRAWEFSSTSNERDRPSLSLPLSQEFVSLMETLGWRGARQDPLTVREVDPNVLQPAILANGVIGQRFTRLSEDSVFTEMALEQQSVEELIRAVFERTLTRPPSADERAMFTELLSEGYAERAVDVEPDSIRYYVPQTSLVSWSNHLDPEANEIMIRQEGEVRRGDPPTVRLVPDWRERLEDMLWTLLNSPEFVTVP